MSLEALYGLIQKHALGEVLSSNTPHRLALACLYALNTFSESDMCYQEAIRATNLEGYANPEEIEYITVGVYCILASYQTLYDMPHMLNRRFRQGKICTHAIFGEALSYLVSLTLVAEAHRVLLQIPHNGRRLRILEVLDKEIFDFQKKSQILENFETITRPALEADYAEIQRVLLRNAITSTKILAENRIACPNTTPMDSV